MRSKVTLVLIFLNVALFFFIFKFERNWRTEAQSLESRRRVLGPEAADIRSLEIVSTVPTGSFTLVRQRDTWSLHKPLDWPANPHAASSIVNELQLLEHEANFRVADLSKNNQSLADFGLDKPKLTVTFSSSDPAIPGGAARPSTSLKIGDATKDGKRLYVLSPNGDRVHVVKRALLDSLSIPLDQLRADSLLSVRVFEARSIIIQTGATGADASRSGIGVRVRIRRDGTRWTFDAPITARAARTTIELAINELNALRAKSFPPAGTGPLPSAAPTLKVTLEGNNRQEILYLGEPVTSATPPAQGTVEYYAQLDGRSALFTVVVPTLLLDALRNAQETLREKRILDIEAAAVTAVTLASPVQPNLSPLTLQRLEPPAGQVANVAPPWQIIRRSEATATGPQTLPADRATVQKLLELLSLLSAEKFTSDAPTSADLEEWGFNRPAREIILTSSGGTVPVVLRLGTDAARNVYARVGTPTDAGNSIYQVGPEILNVLPVAPFSWRDRAVTEPLPAAARISSLRLTDLETKQVLLETTFNPAGEPAGPLRDPKAVRDIVTALRALRAAEFVPGGFTEKVAAAGDDRPWRYQLEAVISLPGTAGANQTSTLALNLTERLGGNQQFGGIKQLDTVFSLEQPLIDALWAVIYGPRDPGPRTEPGK